MDRQRKKRKDFLEKKISTGIHSEAEPCWWATEQQGCDLGNASVWPTEACPDNNNFE